MKRPTVGLAIMFAAGIWLGAQVNWSPMWLAGGMLLFLLAWQIRPATLTILLAVACAGMFSDRIGVKNSVPEFISNLLEHRDQNATVRGVVVSEPAVNDDRQRFVLELSALNRAAMWTPATGRILVLARPPVAVRYGDELECALILRVPPAAGNPGTFDWRQWLAQQNILFTGTLGAGDRYAVVAHGRGRWMTATALRLRVRMERALRLGLVDEPKIAGALTAIVLGERQELPPETYAEFQRTGVFHVFAINGLHVGWVTAVVVLVLRLMRVPRRWTALPAIPVLVLYVIATGAHPGAVRALVMVSVWLLGRMLVRPVDLLSSVATAALAILVWNPVELFDGGFLLSFAVVIALATLTVRTTLWKHLLNPSPEEKLPAWLAWLQPDPLLPRVLVPAWRQMVTHLLAVSVVILDGSFVAWLGLVPLMAVYFHLFTPVSIVANLLVLPLLGGVVALGLTSMLAHAVWPWLTVTLNNANFFLLGIMIRGVEWLSRLPGGHWFVPPPPVWLTVGYYAVLVVWMSRQIPRHVKLWCTAGAVAVAAIVLAIQHEAVVEITVLDLRDGMAVFVNLPGTAHDFLVDGGGRWSGERIVVPFLRGQGVNQLEALVMTRGDKAHAAGLLPVLREIPIRQAIYAGSESRSEIFSDWWKAIQGRRLEIVEVHAGEDWHVTGKFRWRVLNLPTSVNSHRSDNNSLAMLLEYGPTRVLLASDIGQTMEHRLAVGKVDIRAQILVKGRHSAEPSGTDEFLDAVQPAVVIQAVGAEPSRYLEPDLRDRLRRRGTPLYRTDETGAVLIRLKTTGYEIRSWLDPQQQAAWRLLDEGRIQG